MPKRATGELQRVHIQLYSQDVVRLHQIFDHTVGFSAGIREIVKKFCNQLEANVQQTAKPKPQRSLLDVSDDEFARLGDAND